MSNQKNANNFSTKHKSDEDFIYILVTSALGFAYCEYFTYCELPPFLFIKLQFELFNYNFFF